MKDERELLAVRSVDEVAAALGVSSLTVRRTELRALEKLRQGLLRVFKVENGRLVERWPSEPGKLSLPPGR